jgi:hypothetical protein
MATIDVNDTFLPAQEIMDPSRFAGRKEAIRRAVEALCTPGASILVYGDRGVGKTSFVEMVKLIAQDQVELIHRYKLNYLKPTGGFQYRVLSVECDEDVDSTEKVLQRLITSPEGIRGVIAGRIERVERTIKDRYALNFLKDLFVVDSSTEEKIVKAEFQEKSVYELFTNLILCITRDVLDSDEGLLIVVDEFDQVKNSTKFSAMIKTLSKNKVKFLISGVAGSYTDLIAHHASIQRQLLQGTIKINPMLREEVQHLFELVEGGTERFITFEKRFEEEVFEKSRGYPHFVQLFGHLALRNFVELHGINRPAFITMDYLKRGLENFALHEPRLEEIYLNLMGNDPGKELLLKALAMQSGDRIQEGSPLRYCEKRGLQSPKKTLATLLAYKTPEVLLRMDKDHVRFGDSLFRVYANVRKPVLLEQTQEGYRLAPQET